MELQILVFINRINLSDKTFMYLAHIRGRREMGQAWYEDGKMMRKTLSLILLIVANIWWTNKYTHLFLYANGGSAGDLLMGASTANMANRIWVVMYCRCAVCGCGEHHARVQLFPLLLMNMTSGEIRNEDACVLHEKSLI